MIRCEKCGGFATPGLAGLHGNPLVPLCLQCTKEVLEKMENAEKSPKPEVVDEWARVLALVA